MDQQITKLQEALNLLAQVCDVHVATAREHRKIAESLTLVSQSLSQLLREKMEREAAKQAETDV